jgi:hypothetical protein
MIASLDAAADVQLMLSTGQELLGWLLQEPEAMGAAIGLLINEVVNMERLERAVARNDEVRRMMVALCRLLHLSYVQLINIAASYLHGTIAY